MSIHNEISQDLISVGVLVVKDPGARPIPADFLKDGVVQCKSPARAAGGAALEVSRGNTFDLTRNGVLFTI